MHDVGDQNQLIKEVFDFLKDNYFRDNSSPHLAQRWGKPTIVFKHHREQNIECTIVFDESNTFKEISQRIQLSLVTIRSLVSVYCYLKNEFEQRGFFKPEGFNPYLLLMMLISCCQMEYEGKKFLDGLEDDNCKGSKVDEQELERRFFVIYHNCIKNNMSKSYYFSILKGKI